MSKFIIYALHHDDSPHVYVGRSSRGMSRPQQHGLPSAKKRYPVSKWAAKLVKLGKQYSIAVLEECETADQLVEAEMFHIACLRSMGVPLLNCTDGGEGCIGWRPSPETREKMRLNSIGRVLSEEAKRKISAFHKGRKYGTQTRLNMSAAAQRRSPETIEKAAAANRGRKASEETRKKLSFIRTGNVPTVETRIKLSVAKTGRVVSPETCAKLSVIAKQRSNKHLAAYSASLKGKPLEGVRREKIMAGVAKRTGIPCSALRRNAIINAWKRKLALIEEERQLKQQQQD